ERFHREGQDVNVEQSVVIDGMRIGGWIEKQRAAYKIGQLSAERIARLETIGFKWKAFNSQWNDYFTILARLHREGQDVNVGQSVVVDGLRIGLWVYRQREAYMSGRLSAKHFAKLDAIGFTWPMKSKSF